MSEWIPYTPHKHKSAHAWYPDQYPFTHRRWVDLLVNKTHFSQRNLEKNKVELCKKDALQNEFLGAVLPKELRCFQWNLLHCQESKGLGFSSEVFTALLASPSFALWVSNYRVLHILSVLTPHTSNQLLHSHSLWADRIAATAVAVSSESHPAAGGHRLKTAEFLITWKWQTDHQPAGKCFGPVWACWAEIPQSIP